MNPKLKVLCVEDEHAVSDYIISLLDKNRFTVSVIADGKEALDFLLTTDNPPDIVLLDNFLPSMDGIQILEELKHQKEKYAIIFLTSDETLDSAIHAMKEGAIDYLAKSIYLKMELNYKVEKVFKQFKENQKVDHIEEQLSMLSQAVEQSPSTVIITDKEGHIKYVNKKFCEITGYEKLEVIGKTPRILRAQHYPPEFFENLWHTISNGKTWIGEFVNRKKNGEIFMEKSTISPIFNKQGEIISYLATKEDITELKKTERELKEKRAELNNFFTVTPDLLSIIDNSTNQFIVLNEAWKSCLGYELDELINHPFTDFVHEEDLASTRNASRLLAENGVLLNFTNRYRCKDGSYKFLEWNCITNENGTFYSSARDVTNQKIKEKALKESEANFRSIFDMSNAGIFFGNSFGQIVLVNKAFRDMVGYSFKDLYHMDFSQFTYIDDMNEENQLLKQLVENKIQYYRLDKRYISKTGQVVWVDLALTVVRDEKNEPVHYIGVAKDITQRKQYEQQLQEINSTKDKFFSVIAHDLRSQFGGIQGLSELLVEDMVPENERKRFTELIYGSVKGSLSLLEDLLEWSRSQLNGIELNAVDINLHELIGNNFSIAQNQASLKKIEMLNNADPKHIIYADKHMINTVVRNLVNNAIKFTPVNGQIVISGYRENNLDVISIKDNGVGMTREIINKLFTLNAIKSTRGTANEKGTGLGLVLCGEFIKKHGGKIIVNSEVNKGSEFIISLPVNNTNIHRSI